MTRRSASTFFGALFLLNLSFCAPATAAEDGFNIAHEIKSQHFKIYIKDGVDVDRLAMKLAVPAGARATVYSSSSSFGSGSLADQMDLWYLVVAEILDARMKSFESSVKVCGTGEDLSGVANKLFGRDIKTGGFYVVALDSLYIDSENVSPYIFGHELAHAVISKYFVVPPPETIQEVLAGYVEYELRKKTR